MPLHNYDSDIDGPTNSSSLDVLYRFTLSPAVGRASLVAQLVKNPPAEQETLVRFLGQEDPLEKG